MLPTRDDPVVAAASELVGGPAGSRVVSGTGWWTAVRVVLALAALACILGFLQKAPCRADYFAEDVYPRLCYTDIAPLYDGRGFGQGALPYVDTGDWPALEYPVLTGAFMTVASWLTDAVGSPDVPGYITFFDVNVVLLAACALLAVWFVAGTHRRRPWDAAMIAPGLVLTAYINWDLLAVALLAGALWAWSRERPVLTGRADRPRDRGEALPPPAARAAAPALLPRRADPGLRPGADGRGLDVAAREPAGVVGGARRMGSVLHVQP